MMELVQKNKNSNKSTEFMFDSCMPKELNVYNQAELLKTSAKYNSINFNQEKGEIGIVFHLEGDLDGFILCLLKIDNPYTTSKNQHIKSLFTESMNILLGRFLTELEDETNLMSLITYPRLLTKQHMEELRKINLSGEISFQVNYDLITPLYDLPCKIFFCAHKRNENKEV